MDVGMPVRLIFGDSKRGFPAHSVNISMTGMLVHSRVFGKRGTRVRFEFPEFKGEGEVVWARRSDSDTTLCFVGVKFRPLKRRARKTLEGLLNAVNA